MLDSVLVETGHGGLAVPFGFPPGSTLSSGLLEPSGGISPAAPVPDQTWWSCSLFWESMGELNRSGFIGVGCDCLATACR